MTVKRITDALKVRAQLIGDRIAHDDTRRTITFAQWDREADEIGGGLAAAGLVPGDRVFLPISNSNAVEMAIAVFAVLRAGGIACPINVRLSPQEVQDYADLIEPRFAIYNDFEPIKDLKLAGAWSVDDMPRNIDALPDQDSLDPNADAEILGTSGTTGKIKGVVVSHPDLLNGCDGTKIVKSNGTIHAIPFTGSGGNLGVLMNPVYTGGTSWTQPKFDPAGFAKLVEEKKSDTIYLVPTMLRLILDLPNVRDFDWSASKNLMTGTAPLPADSVQRALELWPHLRMINSYGMSEGGIGIRTSSNDMVRKPGCVGKMPAHMQLRDDDGNAITETGVVGEIFGKQSNPRRYWRDEEATKSGFVDGWTKTGDLGFIDQEGDLIICGRSKELIIRGGYNITPIEIETVLYSHPAVQDAAVIGVPHEVLGEDIAAAVSLRPGESVTAEELTAFAKSKLADNKVPRTLVILPELPLNPNGKILKRDLKPVLEEAAAARRAAAG